MTQEPGPSSPMSERMQSLLSRAVEDQLSEQRQLAGALSEVRAQIARLGIQLESMQVGGGGAPADLENLVGAMSGEVREAVRLLGERLDGVGRLVQQRGHDLAEQRAAIDELKDAVDRHSKAVDGMIGGLGAVPALGERIDALQGGLGGLGDRLRGLEELTAGVAALHQRAEAVDGGLRELRQAFSGVAARAAQLPGRDELDAVGGRMAETVDGLGGRLTRLETAVPSLFERLDALGAVQAEMRDELAGLAEGIEGVRAEAGGPDLAATLAELRSVAERLESAPAVDLTPLQERVEALRDALTGPDGVLARLEALEPVDEDEDDVEAVEPLDADTVEGLVASAVAASEARLAAHVDDAVLALAEALLRRRPTRAGVSLAGAVAAGSPAPAPTGQSAAARIIDEDDDEDDDFDDDEEIPGLADRPLPAEGRAVAREPEPADFLSGEPGDDAAARRKPWWRPGG